MEAGLHGETGTSVASHVTVEQNGACAIAPVLLRPMAESVVKVT